MLSRRKIVIAARDPSDTGGGKVAVETAKRLFSKGYEVVFVADTDLLAPVPGVKLDKTPFGNTLKNWKPKHKVLKRVRHFLQMITFSFFARIKLIGYAKQGFVSIDHNIEAFGGDILVLHNVFIEQFRADKRPFRLRVVQFFNPVFSYRLFREWFVLNYFSVSSVIGVSEQTIQEASPLLRDGTSTHVIVNGVDLDRFSPLSLSDRLKARQDLGVEGKFVLLFVGHEFERKKLSPILEALVDLPAEVILWVVGGQGSIQNNYENLAAKLGVAERVFFFGTKLNTEYYFQLADLFVLPSDYETWGLVVLEAMGCALPVVMTPVGCAPYVINEGVNGGIILARRSVIVEKVLKLFLTDDMQAMRASARETAEGFSWEVVGDRYAEVIDHVFQRKE